MKRPIKCAGQGRRRFGLAGLAVISFWAILCCLPSFTLAQVTIPVLVDYFDTGGIGSNSPDGITYISTGIYAGNYAIVDDLADKVFIVDPSGIL